MKCRTSSPRQDAVSLKIDVVKNGTGLILGRCSLTEDNQLGQPTFHLQLIKIIKLYRWGTTGKGLFCLWFHLPIYSFELPLFTLDFPFRAGWTSETNEKGKGCESVWSKMCKLRISTKSWAEYPRPAICQGIHWIQGLSREKKGQSEEKKTKTNKQKAIKKQLNQKEKVF